VNLALSYREQAGTGSQQSKALLFFVGMKVPDSEFTTSNNTEIRTQRHFWKRFRKPATGALWNEAGA
jgi:hypothetical protein